MNQKKRSKLLATQSDEFIKEFEMLNKELFAEDIKIKKKSDFLTFFVKKGFTITLRNAIHIDPKKQLGIDTLYHECQHYIDQCTYKDGQYHKSLWGAIKFYVKYTFPQNLAVFSLLSILSLILWNPFYLLFLVFLLGLLPTPNLTIARKNYELRGYFWSWLIGERRDFTETFSDASYYYMDHERTNNYYLHVFKGFKILIESSDKYMNMKRLYKYYKKLEL